MELVGTDDIDESPKGKQKGILEINFGGDDVGIGRLALSSRDSFFNQKMLRSALSR